MKKIQGLCLAALLGASAGFALPAAAADGLSGSISVSGIQFTVVDLDPNDGVAAGFSTITNGTDGATSWYAYNFYNYSLLGEGNATTPFAPVDETLPSNLATSTVHIDASGMALGGRIEGNTTYMSGNFNLLAQTQYENWAGPDFGNTLVLAPNTALLITAVVQVDSALDVTYCPSCNQVTATTSLTAEGHAWGGYYSEEDATWDQDSTASFSSGTTYYRNDDSEYGESVQSLSKTGVLKLHLVNNSGAELQGGLQLTVRAGGTLSTIATATPEPATYALVGLGLAAAGWQARRRKVART